MADKQIKNRDFAKLCNLKNAKHYNDQVVQIIQFIEETKRWQVELLSQADKYLSVKPQNLSTLVGYNADIVDQLVAFQLGTKLEILEAMHFVIDKQDINMITDYLTKNDHTFNDNSIKLPMTIAKKVELAVEGYICAIFGREMNFVYPRDISKLCMLYLSNIFSNCQYILISNNKNPIIYGTSLKVISESETKEIQSLKGDYVLNCISAQHPKIKTSHLIGLGVHRIKTYTNHTKNAVELDNSFFIHHVQNESNNIRYIPLEFSTSHGFFYGEQIGYPLLIAFDQYEKRITNKELRKEIFSVISHVIKEGKHGDDAFVIKAVCAITGKASHVPLGDSFFQPKLADRRKIFDISKSDGQIIQIDLLNMLKINIGVKSKSSIREFYRYWKVFNCKRDAITAPVQEFMSVAYGLVGNPDDTIFVDRKIDVNMTVGDFKNYIIQKHPKWITDESNEAIVLTDHLGIADHELLSAAGKEPLRLHVEQRDNCLIQ